MYQAIACHLVFLRAVAGRIAGLARAKVSSSFAACTDQPVAADRIKALLRDRESAAKE